MFGFFPAVEVMLNVEAVTFGQAGWYLNKKPCRFCLSLSKVLQMEQRVRMQNRNYLKNQPS